MIAVKICGITRLEDALAAQESGADALGFIFYEKSKRFITDDNAAKIIKNLNPFIAKVGVFVNESSDKINEISAHCGLTHIQLHGTESPETVKHINRIVIKAINYTDNLSREISMWQGHPLLIDSGSKDIPGGTGQTLPWDVLKNLNIDRPYILAGGLTVNNIELALKMLNPAAVDVSSGVENSPGIKDHRLIKKFIEQVKRYSYTNEIL